MRRLEVLTGFPFWLRQARLAKLRQPIGRNMFIARAASSPRGREAAHLLWDKLSQLAIADGFTPYPDDDLLRIYGLADEDLDEDIILDILQRLRLDIPTCKALDRLGPIRTPAEIVRLVETD